MSARPAFLRFGSLLLVASLSNSCGGTPDSERLLVLCAASMAPAVEQLATRFELAHEVVVRISSGGSNSLAQQVRYGAGAALFVSANRVWADEVEARYPSQARCVLATNELALIVPTGNPAEIRTLSDLAAERVRRIALAGEHVPAGAYADRALAAAGLAEALAPKIVRGHSVRVALGFVERGEVDAGIVYASDVRLSAAIELVEGLDPSSHARIEYHLLLLSPAPAARALYDELTGTDAARVFEERGFSAIER